MFIDFPGGSRVDAHFGTFTIITDQPYTNGGESSAPTPFAYFLASIGTCVGICVLDFCRQRNISTDGIQIVQSMHANPASGMIEKISLDIQTPMGFPEKYLPSLVRLAHLCSVKKHIEHPPQFDVNVHIIDPQKAK